MKKKNIKKAQLKSEYVFKKIAAESLGVFVVSTFMLFTLFGVKLNHDMQKESNNPANIFKQTEEYAMVVNEEINVVNQRYAEGEIDLEQANSEIEYINSDEYAAEKLVDSSNSELVALLKQQEKKDSDLNKTILVVGLPFSISFVGTIGSLLLAADAKEFAPKNKEDESPEEANQI